MRRILANASDNDAQQIIRAQLELLRSAEIGRIETIFSAFMARNILNTAIPEILLGMIKGNTKDAWYIREPAPPVPDPREAVEPIDLAPIVELLMTLHARAGGYSEDETRAEIRGQLTDTLRQERERIQLLIRGLQTGTGANLHPLQALELLHKALEGKSIEIFLGDGQIGPIL